MIGSPLDRLPPGHGALFQQFDDAVRDRLVDVQSHRRLRRSVGDQMGWALCQCVHVLPLSSYD